MKSIKPGRGPSMMGGFMSIVIGLIGVFWTLSAISMGAPFFFCMFGVVFVVIAVVQAVYNFKNATSKNRYSVYDITDVGEETDPLNEKYGNTEKPQENIDKLLHVGLNKLKEEQFLNKGDKIVIAGGTRVLTDLADNEVDMNAVMGGIVVI